MKPKTFMIIAGEASGDVLAAELVTALCSILPEAEAGWTADAQPLRAPLEPRFFGAGGPRLAEAGMEVVLDLTAHSVVGLSEVLRKFLKFKKIFFELRRLAIARQPEAIICVDYSGFNLRFAQTIKRYVRSLRGTFGNWNPAIIQYVSPQVWASRPGRATRMERSLDLVLSIFPFEPDWYAKRAPALQVKFVGHPLVDRYAGFTRPVRPLETSSNPLVVLLPGSRPAELERHLPVMAEALQKMGQGVALRHRVILPSQTLLQSAQKFQNRFGRLEFRVGGLAENLAEADLAIASTGTVTMECAWFGVPAVTLYKASWSTYRIAKRLVQVRFLAMPNLLANEAIYPEFVQDQATPDALARAGLELLSDKARRLEIKAKLEKILQSLGPPGACRRAAQAIAHLLVSSKPRELKAALYP